MGNASKGVAMSAPTTTPGTVQPELSCADGEKLAKLVYRRELSHPRGVVWDALTVPSILSRWFGNYTGDPTTGTVRVTMRDDQDTSTTDAMIVRCTPPAELVVDIDGWYLELILRADGDHTALTFTHPHVPRSETGEIGPGWQYYLDRLEAVLDGTPTPEWADYLDLTERYR